MIQTTLYFGRNISFDGELQGEVKEISWELFKIRSINIRFDEYTELRGHGAWEGAQEQTFVLIIIWDDTVVSSKSNDKIQQIRRDYCEDFLQNCVLRVDQKVEVVR